MTRSIYLRSLLVLSVAASTLLPACQTVSSEEPEVIYGKFTPDEHATIRRTLDLPPNFYEYKTPEVSNARAMLGRVLFYDKRLSANNSVSCASCHKQDKGFADDVALSKGFDGKLTKRNSLALGAVLNFQLSYAPVDNLPQRFFWDERAATIEEQSTQTIQDPIEMGMDLDALGEKLLQEDYYQVLFEKAFPHGPNHLTLREKVLMCLADFINTMISDNSLFDDASAALPFDQPFPLFSSEQNTGKALYNQHCASCHGQEMVRTSVKIACNGLDETYADKGMGNADNFGYMDGVFKVPMLRNVALTGPYMHDGRFATLEEVVEHYNSGIQATPALNAQLKDAAGNPKRLNLTDTEKQALVAFLHTLTDQTSLMHVRFSDPFKQ